MIRALSKNLLCLWAGVSLGGSFIAAPAKFTAPSLSLNVALEVGRAQFYWLGFGEAIIGIAYLISFAFISRKRWILGLMPLAVFALERLIALPALAVRTTEVIAGGDPGPSQLHLVYIALEAIKFIFLIMLGFGIIKLYRPEASNTRHA